MTQNWEVWLLCQGNCAAIQRQWFCRLEKWAGRIFMLFKKRKRKVLHLVRKSHRHQDMLGATQLEISSAEKDQGIQQVGCEPAVCPCSKEFCNICPSRSDQQFTCVGILSPTVAEGHATWGDALGPDSCCSLSSLLSPLS